MIRLWTYRHRASKPGAALCCPDNQAVDVRVSLVVEHLLHIQVCLVPPPTHCCAHHTSLKLGGHVALVIQNGECDGVRLETFNLDAILRCCDPGN